ncbi:MliC family protein [Variovorax sp. GT1P44]|uniref:MliC family protein n=1 Tax=Variovorax sp. GT1P44 TaxID=3443742 RepID=UPI003F46EE7C
MRIARTLSIIALPFVLLAGMPASAASPSFSCARAEGAAQQAVCQDDTLAALDRENARLYALARATPGLSAQRRSELTATQRGWIKGRDDCWKASDLKTCIRDAYMMRIAELRTGYAGAQGKGKGGVSIGPVRVTCPDVPAMNATFVNVDPPLAYLSGGDRSIVLTIARSGSGARYTARTPEGEATFWQKGPEAMVQLPGGKEQTCRVGALE